MMPDVPFPVSQDRLLGNRLVLVQPRDGYRVAIDPVLLAASVPAGNGDRVLDLGCGIGTAALCLLARVGGATVTGIDIQPGLVTLARHNALENGLGDRSSFHACDLFDWDATGFDHVLVNPPYLAPGTASVSPNPIKALANVEGSARLADWVVAAIAAARPGGSVTFIHRADRTGELRALMAAGLGQLRLLPLRPRAGAHAKRVILQGGKGAPAGFVELPGIDLHVGDGGFSAAADAVLRGAAALPLDRLSLTAPSQGR